MKKFAILVLLLAVSPLSAQTALRFPMIVPPPTPPSPVPPPIPTPSPVTKLPADTLYCVEGDVPFLLFTLPKDLVKVTKKEGPCTVYGKFIDGNGKSEFRDFKSKYLWIVESSGVGTVDFIWVPVGAMKESDAITKTLDVDNGQGPRPPPIDDSFTKALAAAYVADGKQADKVVQLAAVYKKSGAIVNNPSYTKHKEILDTMHAAIQSALDEPDASKVTILPNIRRVLANEFNAAIGGKTGTVLDATSRALIAAEFLKAQRALEAIR